MAASGLQEVTLSFVRVNGQNPPPGQVLRIGEVRIEISTDPPYDLSQQLPRPPGSCYC
jgi:tyrosinase